MASQKLGMLMPNSPHVVPRLSIHELGRAPDQTPSGIASTVAMGHAKFASGDRKQKPLACIRLARRNGALGGLQVRRHALEVALGQVVHERPVGVRKPQVRAQQMAPPVAMRPAVRDNPSATVRGRLPAWLQSWLQIGQGPFGYQPVP